MLADVNQSQIFDGDGDQLLANQDQGDKITLLPDSDQPKQTHTDPRIRIMWGQWLLEDLLTNRFRSLVCAVNSHDNSHGIITQLAQLLPTSQWHESSITSHAKHFVQPNKVTVVKYDMDAVEVLALLRPAEHEHLTLDDLSTGFKMVSQMLHCRPQRLPSASVCFLGARANQLVGSDDQDDPSFEAVLRTMYEAGYQGDVYPATWMWQSSTPVFARYPFPDSLERMREGGF